MPQLQFKRFHNPRKKRCDCCDCTAFLDFKILVTDEELLVGDLELCKSCAQILHQASTEAKETVVEEWSF